MARVVRGYGHAQVRLETVRAMADLEGEPARLFLELAAKDKDGKSPQGGQKSFSESFPP